MTSLLGGERGRVSVKSIGERGGRGPERVKLHDIVYAQYIYN